LPNKRRSIQHEQKGKFDYHSSRFFSLFFLGVYLGVLTLFCLSYGVIPGPEFILLLFLFYAAYNRRTWRFLKDWLPFVTVFLSYEAMNSVVGLVARNNLHGGPYSMESQLFGQLPTLVLQNSIRLPLLDYMGAFFYSLHFFAPTIFAFILWRKSPKNYWKYTVAFGVCTYSALITFLIYPVAPPWWQLNSLYNPSWTDPEVVRILTSSVDVSIGFPVYRAMFDFLSPNQFAAFPSLHSALPFLVSLFALRIWKLKAVPVLTFPVGVWFSAVYLGEHYVVDVIGGIFYATFAFVTVEKVLPLLSARLHFLKKHVPKPEAKPIE